MVILHTYVYGVIIIPVSYVYYVIISHIDIILYVEEKDVFTVSTTWQVEDEETEIQLQHTQPLQFSWQVKLDQVIQTVIDGPIKLVRLVACQYKHKPAGKKKPQKNLYHVHHSCKINKDLAILFMDYFVDRHCSNN